LVAKPLSPYYEKSKPSVWKVYGSNSSPYQRLGTEVIASSEIEAMQKARQKWNLNVGGRTEEEFFSTNGWSAERVGDVPAEQTAKYEIYNNQTGNSMEPADGITNDADALVRLNDYIEHGPHALNREQATAMFGIRTTSGVEIVDIDIPMAQGRAATSPTGQWKIVDGLGRELFRFRPAFSNTRAIANELAALWARENNFDGNYQVEPAEDTAPAPTPDQQQGGLIDIAGSTNDLARQRATPGTFTGAWKIIDNDGNEMHRFSGIGNDQRDANRVATQWVQNNGYAYGTEIEVVPIMSESIAEGADKKYTIKKSYTMSKAGVEKSVWHIMDGDFVVDVTDLRRDAKYYADKWNAAEKESANASQNQHKQGVAEGSQEINWVKPNFDFEWHEVEEQSRMKQVPIDVRQYYQKHFPNKDAWLKAVQNGKAVVVPPDHAYEIRNAPFDKASLQKVLAPTGHEGPIGPAKEKRVNDLFDKGQVEMPIILKTSQGLWLIGGKTRLGTANYVKGLPAKVWLISGKQGVAEGIEFFAMPLRMSEYRGKTHPATNEPYDSKFKFSGDLTDRVHGLLDAGTKPTLLQVNPRHLLATQDWLSTQGGGKPPFATMKQHPVVLQKNNKLYILDGHHRSADAHKSGTPIQVYLFKDEL
jgi:hypothetical protein